MHENVLLVVDYEKICRLCLRTTSAMSDIFETDGENSLKELILYATGLDVQQGDDLPSKVCHKCRYVVELSCELRTMVMKVHSLLRSTLDNGTLTEHLEEYSEINAGTDRENRKPDLKLVVQDNGNVELMKQESVHTRNINLIKAVRNIRHTDNTQHEGNVGAFQIVNFDEAENNMIQSEDGEEKQQFPSTERIRKAAPKLLTCQICLETFASAEEVRWHVDAHYTGSNLTPYLQQQRPFECEMCKDGAISKAQLVRHHRRHLGVNPFVCRHEGCGFVAKNQNSLRHHCAVHLARAEVCAWCGARYRRRWELRQHEARAHRPEPRDCRLCRRAFRNDIAYRAHLRTHTNPPRYLCSWRGCTKAYRSPAALAAHTRLHAGERRYQCVLCSAAAYTSQSLLNRHLRVHQRMHQRKHISKCDKCAATFEEYGDFYRHRIGEHVPSQQHCCAGCNQGFQSELKLSWHERTCELALRMRPNEDEEEEERREQDPEKTEDLVDLSAQEMKSIDCYKAGSRWFSREGYFYVAIRTRGSTTSIKCCNARCPARFTVKKGQATAVIGAHNHTQTPWVPNRNTMYQALRRRATEESIPLSVIYEQEAARLLFVEKSLVTGYVTNIKQLTYYACDYEYLIVKKLDGYAGKLQAGVTVISTTSRCLALLETSKPVNASDGEYELTFVKAVNAVKQKL